MVESDPLTPMWTDIVQAIGTGITAFATIFVIYQIILTRKQIASAEAWNRFNATFQYFTSEKFTACERAVAEALKVAGINLYKVKEPLSPEVISRIWDNPMIFVEVRNYLNFLESYATTVNKGRLDEECAYSIAASSIIRLGSVFQPYIDKWRIEDKDHELFTELQTLSENWRRRFIYESSRHKASIERALKQMKKEKL